MPDTFQRQSRPSSTSVVSKPTHRPTGVCTRPCVPVSTNRSSPSAAVITGDHSAQRVVSERTAHAASGVAPTVLPTSNVKRTYEVGQEADLGEALDDHGHALAAADAHRLEPVGLVERLQVVDEGGHDGGT